jgi:hypothetical protein
MAGRGVMTTRIVELLRPAFVICVTLSLLTIPSVAGAQKIPKWKLDCLRDHKKCDFSVSGTITSEKVTEGKGRKGSPDGSFDDVSAKKNHKVTISVSGTVDEGEGTVDAVWTFDKMDDYRQIVHTNPMTTGLCDPATNSSTWRKTCASGQSITTEMIDGKRSGNGFITLTLPKGKKYMTYKYSLSLAGGLPKIMGKVVTHPLAKCVGVLCPGEEQPKPDPEGKFDVVLTPDVLTHADELLDAKNPFHLKGSITPKAYPAEPYPGAVGKTNSSISWDLTVTVTPKKPPDPRAPLK